MHVHGRPTCVCVCVGVCMRCSMIMCEQVVAFLCMCVRASLCMYVNAMQHDPVRASARKTQTKSSRSDNGLGHGEESEPYALTFT